MKDNRLKRGAMAAGAVGMSLFMTAAFPMSALAGSPEFAYTQEKWAALRDNVMEYEELNDLIHEYNATVLNNRAEYDDYRGKSSDRFKNDYADTVQDLYDASDKMLENVDEDQPGYASALAGSISTRIQAQRMQETADSENMDGDIKKLEYDRQEAELVRTAQTKMNQYWQKVKNRQSLEASLSLAQARESAASVRVQAGMEPQARLMEAQEAVQSAQASIQASDQEMDTVRRELCLLTGWSYDASPEIREIPVTRTVDRSPRRSPAWNTSTRRTSRCGRSGTGCFIGRRRKRRRRFRSDGLSFGTEISLAYFSISCIVIVRRRADLSRSAFVKIKYGNAE